MIITLSVLAISCSKGNNTAAKKLLSQTDTVLSPEPGETNMPKIPKIYEQEIINTCDAQARRQNFFERIFTPKSFDYRYSAEITSQVVSFIHSYVENDRDVDRDNFWQILPEDISRNLNRYLLERHLNLSDDEFNQVKSDTALFMILRAQSDREFIAVEYSIPLSEERTKTYYIAYDEQAEINGAEVIGLCETPAEVTDVDDKLADTENYSPSDVRGKVSCANRNGTTVNFTEYNFGEVEVEIYTDQFAYIRTISSQSIQKSERGDWLDLHIANGSDEFTLKLKREQERNSLGISWIRVRGNISGTDVDLRNLRCDNIKRFPLAYDEEPRAQAYTK